jgi:hypothetical protein
MEGFVALRDYPGLYFRVADKNSLSPDQRIIVSDGGIVYHFSTENSDKLIGVTYDVHRTAAGDAFEEAARLAYYALLSNSR